MTEQHSEPLTARKLSTPMLVSREDLDYAAAYQAYQRAWEAMTPEQRAAAQAEQNRRAAEAFADAQADWQATRDRLADNPQAVAVLDVHQPEAASGAPQCSLSESEEWGTEWPCSTYTAIKDA